VTARGQVARITIPGLLEQYVGVGLDPSVFWALTPALYAIHLDGAVRRLDREAREMAWAVWHVAALSRAKKLPRLDRFIPGKNNVAPKSPTWQAQLAAWQTYAERKKTGS